MEGAGSPTVVFEPAIGDVGLTWGLVQPLVSPSTTTFTHDRPGLGASDPVPGPRVVEVMVDELRGVMGAAGLEPPYLLVGHSFASLTVRAYAHRFPQDVAGLVLVDGAHEDQMRRFPAELDPASMFAGMITQLRDMAEQARLGQSIPDLTPVPTGFPSELAAAYRQAVSPTAVRVETVAAEYEGIDESQSQVRELAARGHGELPIVVLRHGIPQPIPGVTEDVNRRYEETWQQLQIELAARSTNGEVRVADGAGHMIHHERPDLAASAILDLLSTATVD